MGCFGDMTPVGQKTGTSTQTVKLPDWVEAAGQENYNLAKGILDKGYQPYTGERVAGLSGNEQAAGDLIGKTAASGNPYEADSSKMLYDAGSAPAYQYNFASVVDPNGPLGPMSNYINPYLQAVLDPAMRQIGVSGAKARQGIDSSATMSGAFGDARHGVVESEQRKNQAQLETDTTGKAWMDAFNTAMGQRQTDLGRNFQTQQAQAGENKSALDRMRQSSIDLTNLDKYGVSRALGLSSALGTAGANERGVEQAKLDADYGEAMRKQGFTQNQIQFLASLLAGTPTSKTTTGETTQTESKPDNSGWQAIGSIASDVIPFLI